MNTLQVIGSGLIALGLLVIIVSSAWYFAERAEKKRRREMEEADRKFRERYTKLEELRRTMRGPVSDFRFAEEALSKSSYKRTSAPLRRRRDEGAPFVSDFPVYKGMQESGYEPPPTLSAFSGGGGGSGGGGASGSWESRGSGAGVSDSGSSGGSFDTGSSSGGSSGGDS